MTQILRKIIAAAAALLLLLVMYFGSFLPMVKSRLFIEAIRSSGGTHSVAEFKTIVSRALDAPSPIGQEELVRNSANIIASLVQQSGVEPEVLKELLSYLDSYYQPIMKRGRGMSFTQNLYLLGVISETMFVRTGDSRYLAAAKSYFEQGLVVSPGRPQFLFGMLDVLQLEKNTEGVKKIAEQILSQWPNEGRVRALLESLPKTGEIES